MNTCSSLDAAKDFVAEGRRALLFVGAVSQNTIDVVIETANEMDLPLGLVATRRQIEARDLGGGYVNGLCTETYADHVRAQDVRRRIVLERDHGGPWQGNVDRERSFNVMEAMTAAKASFKADIVAGFDVLHIDPSKGSSGTHADLETFTGRTIELIDYCVEEASSCGRASPPAFEIGTDEGALATSSPKEIEEMYKCVQEHCEHSGIERPIFLALPTGTMIGERRNIGPLDARIIQHGDIDAAGPVARLLAFGHDQDVLIKQHSADYLSDPTLAWIADSSIDAVNVAPQIGVTETLCFVESLRQRGHFRLIDDFIALAVASGQWERWIEANSPANDFERAILAGHYVMTQRAMPDAKHLHERAADLLALEGEVLDDRLREAVRCGIIRQLRLLSLTESNRNTPAALAGETI